MTIDNDGLHGFFVKNCVIIAPIIEWHNIILKKGDQDEELFLFILRNRYYD